MRLYCVVTARSRFPVEVFLAREDAEQAIAEALRDEPEWHGLLSVEEAPLWWVPARSEVSDHVPSQQILRKDCVDPSAERFRALEDET